MKTTREVLNPNGRSPYVRYRKRPWKYSEQLLKLSAARREGAHGLADRLAREHSQAHGLRVPFAFLSIRVENPL